MNIRICDVTLRDGIQSLPIVLSLDDKLLIYKGLLDSGIERFEISSFVSSQRVPQLADCSEFVTILSDHSLLMPFSSSLVLNLKGVERSLKVNCNSLTLVASASESFSVLNSGMTLSQLDSYLIHSSQLIKSAGGIFRGSISMSFGQKDEAVDFNVLLHYIELFHRLGAYEISLADTVSNATVLLLEKLIRKIQLEYHDLKINLHLHGEPTKTIEIMERAIDLGISSFDVSLLGVGGCSSLTHHDGNLSYNVVNSICKKKNIPLPFNENKIKKLEKIFSEMIY